jgi:hypothetical protein
MNKNKQNFGLFNALFPPPPHYKKPGKNVVPFMRSEKGRGFQN